MAKGAKGPGPNGKPHNGNSSKVKK
jgi:hypothetical protein